MTTTREDDGDDDDEDDDCEVDEGNQPAFGNVHAI